MWGQEGEVLKLYLAFTLIHSLYSVWKTKHKQTAIDINSAGTLSTAPHCNYLMQISSQSHGSTSLYLGI